MKKFNFEKECLRLFPKYIKVDGISYKQVAITTVSDLYQFCYVVFDGNFCDWKSSTLCDLSSDNHKELVLQIRNFLLTTPHESLTEVLTKEQMFHKELAALINKYSYEKIGGDTPDFILASYLISCLRNYGHNVDRRTKWYKNED